MKRLALPIVAILLLAGCVGDMRDDGPGGVTSPEPDISFGASKAIGLVNLWRVTGAADEGDETWLRLDANEFQLWRDCGMIMGSWQATDSLFLASVHSASGECASEGIPTVGWLESATAFAKTAGGYELLAEDGGTVASLAIDGAPEPIESAADFFTEPPELTEEVYATFRAPAALPSELEPATADALEGRWIPAEGDASTNPHVEFGADGAWSGSDGCNGSSGCWAVGDGGEFLATAGVSTLIFCEGASVPSWVAQASTAGVDTDGLLHLFDASGTALGTLTH